MDILKNRIEALDCLNDEIHKKMSKEKTNEEFKLFCSYLQEFISKYKTDLENFCKKYPGFNYQNYCEHFHKKDEQLHQLLNQYMNFM